MKTIYCMTTFLLCYFSIAVYADEMRKWSSSNGKYEIEAKLIRVSEDGNTVCLQKPDGRQIDIPVGKLSENDRDFIRESAPIETDERPTIMTSGRDCIKAVLADIDDSEDRSTIAKFINKCILTFEKTDHSVTLEWKNRKNKNTRYGLYDYTFPNGYGKDWAYFKYHAFINIAPETATFSCYMFFYVYAENWEFIDGNSTCLVDGKEDIIGMFPKVNWKREMSNDDICESAIYFLSDFKVDIHNTLASRSFCGIILGGKKYTFQKIPINDSFNTGIRECFIVYNILNKYYKVVQ